MNYEVVNLEEKIVVGVGATTSNNDPGMGELIGGLWDKLYNDKYGVCNQIKNCVNEYAIGLYSDYEFDSDRYHVLAGKEVTKAENDDMVVRVIPAGKYAKFSIHGNMVTAVAKAWDEIWQMDLDRTFTGDFEEYLNCDFDNADIDIYIAIK